MDNEKNKGADMPDEAIEKTVEGEKIWFEVQTRGILPGEELSLEFTEEDEEGTTKLFKIPASTVQEDGRVLAQVIPKNQQADLSSSTETTDRENATADAQTEIKPLKVTKVEGPYNEQDQLVKYVEIGKTYTFKATGFSRKIENSKELENVKWAYKLDGGKIRDFPDQNGNVKEKTVEKSITIKNDVAANNAAIVYVYFENKEVEGNVSFNILIKEVIIIVGTEQHYENNANKLMFPAQAVREIHKNFQDHPNLKVLIFKDGYTHKQLTAFNKAIFNFNKNAKITQIETTEELIDFFNNGQKDIIIEHRKIEHISIYAHGYVRDTTNEGVIAFGYEGSNASKQELDINEFEKLNENKFLPDKQTHLYSYACRTGIGTSVNITNKANRDNSLAQKMANHGNITVHAYLRRSLYSDTWGTENQQNTYISDNDKAGSVWGNIKADINDLINSDPKDIKDFSKYMSTETKINGVIWNPQGAYLPVKAGTTPIGVSEKYETFLPK